MLTKVYSDTELTKLLKDSDPLNRNKAITSLYRDKKLKGTIQSFLMKKGCTKDESQDLFKDALVTLGTSFKKGNFKEDQDLRSYIFGICKYLWLNKIRKKEILEFKEDVPENIETTTPVTKIMHHDNKEVISNLLKSLKKPCDVILKHWAYGYSFAEIAKKTGYASEGMARKKKHQCWQKLLAHVQSNPSLAIALKNLL